MKHFTKVFLTLILLLSSVTALFAASNKGFRADMTFLDFEDITELFSPIHKQVVHVLNHDDSPLIIKDAEVSDRGTVFFKDLTGAQNTYRLKVKNVSGRRILAYEVTWVLKHPFEDYVFNKMTVNSINPVSAKGTQVIKFRRPKHYRDDAYYYAEISRVEFDDDESIWEAPELDEFDATTRLEKIKKQIDGIDEVDLGEDELSDEMLEALDQQYEETEEEVVDEENENSLENLQKEYEILQDSDELNVEEDTEEESLDEDDSEEEFLEEDEG